MTAESRRWWRRYSTYLNSQGWQLTREAAFRRDGYRCRRCGAGNSPYNPLQGNHLSYDAYNRTGHTPVDDVETLCRSCHEEYTGRPLSRGYSSQRPAYRPRRSNGYGVAVIIVIAVLASLIIKVERAVETAAHHVTHQQFAF